VLERAGETLIGERAFFNLLGCSAVHAHGIALSVCLTDQASAASNRFADAACAHLVARVHVAERGKSANARRQANRRLLVSCTPELCRISYLDDELNITAQDVQKRNELADALALVRRIEKPVELRNRSLQSAGQLTPTKSGCVHPLHGLRRKLVNEKLGEITWVFIVLQGLLDVDDAFRTGLEDVCDRLVGEFAIDVRF
jgi:hypothetical protein